MKKFGQNKGHTILYTSITLLIITKNLILLRKGKLVLSNHNFKMLSVPTREDNDNIPWKRQRQRKPVYKLLHT